MERCYQSASLVVVSGFTISHGTPEDVKGSEFCTHHQMCICNLHQPKWKNTWLLFFFFFFHDDETNLMSWTVFAPFNCTIYSVLLLCSKPSHSHRCPSTFWCTLCEANISLNTVLQHIVLQLKNKLVHPLQKVAKNMKESITFGGMCVCCNHICFQIIWNGQ